jgi:hypothetical protein
MVVLNKVYTRAGDDGTTALGTGERRKKYDLRIAAYGTTRSMLRSASRGCTRPAMPRYRASRTNCSTPGSIFARLGAARGLAARASPLPTSAWLERVPCLPQFAAGS